MIGLDEVGRGCFAGPLVVAAVSLNVEITGLRDSKKLSAKQRQKLDVEIRNNADSFAIAWVSAAKIDEIGLSMAHEIAFKDAFSQISYLAGDKVVVDGTINYLNEVCDTATAVAGADNSVEAVMAASIIAKQARDAYMKDVGATYSAYGFESHVGYGTVAHRQAIEEHGVCIEHRLSIKPLRKYASNTGQDSRG